MRGRTNAVSAQRGRGESKSVNLTMVIASIAKATALMDCLDESEFFEISDYYVGRAKRKAKKHHGRVLKRMGDCGFLAVFDRAEDAVDFARKFISTFVEHPLRKYPMLKGVRCLIAIHSGEVSLKKISYGDDVYGPNVMLCAQLYGLAKPEQIVISDSTHAQLAPDKAARFIRPKENEVDEVKKIRVKYWVLNDPKGGTA